MASNYYESETPHFFKVIVEEDLRKNSLIVPSKFVRKYGTNLSSPVRLKIPTGDVSDVQLERNHDGVLSLRNGWADFMDLCCIRFGYFLVFRYEGGSLFNVVVFDVTACEIEYPVRLVNARQRVVSSQENAAGEAVSHEGSQRLNDSVKLDSGREIRDPYPFFQVVVGKSFKKQPLHIKKSFAERHLKGNLGEMDITLECGGNSRPCKLSRYKSRGRRQTVLRGWQKFQRKNGFKVGDTLLIQLLKRKNGFVFRVSNLSLIDLKDSKKA